MKIRRLSALFTFTLCVTLCCGAFAMGSSKGGGPGYKAGSGASVKSWGSKNFEQCKAAHKPVLLYIYDATSTHNEMAKYMEAATLLDDTNVKNAEKDFTCSKVKSTDGTGFDVELTKLADNGACVVVFSADMKVIATFHGMNRNTVTGVALDNAMELALKVSGVPADPNAKKDNPPANPPAANNGNNGNKPAKKNG